MYKYNTKTVFNSHRMEYQTSNYKQQTIDMLSLWVRSYVKVSHKNFDHQSSMKDIERQVIIRRHNTQYSGWMPLSCKTCNKSRRWIFWLSNFNSSLKPGIASPSWTWVVIIVTHKGVPTRVQPLSLLSHVVSLICRLSAINKYVYICREPTRTCFRMARPKCLQHPSMSNKGSTPYRTHWTNFKPFTANKCALLTMRKRWSCMRAANAKKLKSP